MKPTKGKISVVGAGFSGLASAYYLQKAGFEVEVIESSERVGGLIDTIETDFGRIESAANGILSSRRVEKLFQEAGVPMIEAGRNGKKRYFFRGGKARRWPLGVSESLALLLRAKKIFKSPPTPGETVESWALRAVGDQAYRYLLVPALQGMYAGDPSLLSAELIFGRFFNQEKKERPHFRGVTTVAPAGGMYGLIRGLHRVLEERGVRFRFREKTLLRGISNPCVIATSLPAACSLLGPEDPAARAFQQVKMLPLICVHLAYARELPRMEGYGCLFPRGEGIRSLGVLFEESIFEDRSVDHLERWILGGAMDLGVADLSDEELFEIVRKDRKKWIGDDFETEGLRVTRSSPALPHYDLHLLEALRSSAVQDLPKRGIFLVGNYMGKLGLSGILEDAENLPSKILERGAV